MTFVERIVGSGELYRAAPILVSEERGGVGSLCPFVVTWVAIPKSSKDVQRRTESASGIGRTRDLTVRTNAARLIQCGDLVQGCSMRRFSGWNSA